MCLKSVYALLLAVSAVAVAAQPPSGSIKRPKITGISHLAVYTSDAVAADHFAKVRSASLTLVLLRRGTREDRCSQYAITICAPQ